MLSFYPLCLDIAGPCQLSSHSRLSAHNFPQLGNSGHGYRTRWYDEKSVKVKLLRKCTPYPHVPCQTRLFNEPLPQSLGRHLSPVRRCQWRIDKQWPNISDHWTLTPFVNGIGYFVICPCGVLDISRKWWLATKVNFWIDEWEPCLARLVDLNASSLNLQMGLFYKFCMLYNSLLDGHNVLLNPGIQTSRGHYLPPRGFQCGQNAQCFGWIHQTMHEARGEKS